MSDDNLNTFERQPNGQFSSRIPTPESGASSGEAAAILLVGAFVGAGLSWLWDKVTGSEN